VLLYVIISKKGIVIFKKYIIYVSLYIFNLKYTSSYIVNHKFCSMWAVTAYV